jgi:hypothetical protein
LPTVLLLVAANALITWVWVINVEPGKNLGFAMVLIVLWGIYVAETFLVVIIVTPERVRMISGHRNPLVRPEDVNHIRALCWNTVFYDHDGNQILQTHADLSRSQLLALGAELGVPVWDHREWLGLKKLKHGIRLTPEELSKSGPT